MPYAINRCDFVLYYITTLYGPSSVEFPSNLTSLATRNLCGTADLFSCWPISSYITSLWILYFALWISVKALVRLHCGNLWLMLWILPEGGGNEGMSVEESEKLKNNPFKKDASV